MRRGDVVLVDFPFSSGTGAKVRPALVLQSDINNRRLLNTIVAMISSNTRHSAVAATQLLVDPSVPDGRQSGLLHPSVIKCENAFTVEQRLVHRTIGRLQPSMMGQIELCLKAALELK
jgi:mRNA interferase MazF